MVATRLHYRGGLPDDFLLSFIRGGGVTSYSYCGSRQGINFTLWIQAQQQVWINEILVAFARNAAQSRWSISQISEVMDHEQTVAYFRRAVERDTSESAEVCAH